MRCGITRTLRAPVPSSVRLARLCYASPGRHPNAQAARSYRLPVTSTVVEEPGISAVRNAILAEARDGGADFIAMIDDDETASPGWLAELLRIQAAFDADVVGGPVLRDMPETLPLW